MYIVKIQMVKWNSMTKEVVVRGQFSSATLFMPILIKLIQGLSLLRQTAE